VILERWIGKSRGKNAGLGWKHSGIRKQGSIGEIVIDFAGVHRYTGDVPNHIYTGSIQLPQEITNILYLAPGKWNSISL
jgi:hypothetical protein